MYIVFVGDEPSKQNLSKHIPFVGTKSYRTLLYWMYKTDIDLNNTAICNKGDVIRNETTNVVYVNSTICLKLFNDDKIIALGENASKRLREQNISHFKAPHPSGRNRKLNNKSYFIKMIKDMRRYVHEDYTKNKEFLYTGKELSILGI